MKTERIEKLRSFRNLNKEELLKKTQDFLNESCTPEELLEYVKSWDSGFHNYSFFNWFMASFQLGRPCSLLSGFNGWKERGRHVKKGAKGLSIFIPRIKKCTEVVENENGDNEEQDVKRIVGFLTGFVFDSSQTEGDPIQYGEPEIKGTANLSFDNVKVGIEKDGLSVEVTDGPIEGAEGTYCRASRAIQIMSDKNENMIKVLFHEYAHHLIHGVSAASNRNRGLKEMEAETCAYLVMTALGVKVPAALKYKEIWKNRAQGTVDIAGIVKATSRMLRMIESL